MPGLIVADLFPGRRLRMNGVRYAVARGRGSDGELLLAAEDGTGAIVPLHRSELLARLSEGTASLEDASEDPDLANSLPPAIVDFFTLAQLVNWMHRMILFRHLLPLARMSPRSAAFVAEFEIAAKVLDWYRTHSAVGSTKTWRPKTLNDVLRAWRRAGGALAGICVQVVPARRQRVVRPEYELFKGRVRRIAKENPMWSAANVHRSAHAEHVRDRAANPE